MPRIVLPFFAFGFGLWLILHGLFSAVEWVPHSGRVAHLSYPPWLKDSKYVDIEIKLDEDRRIYQVPSKYINQDNDEPDLLPLSEFKQNVRAGDRVELLIDKDDWAKPRVPIVGGSRELLTVVGLSHGDKLYLSPEGVARTWRDDIYFGAGLLLLGLFTFGSLFRLWLSPETSVKLFAGPLLGLVAVAAIYFFNSFPLYALIAIGMAAYAWDVVVFRPRRLLSKWREFGRKHGLTFGSPGEPGDSQSYLSMSGTYRGYNVGCYTVPANEAYIWVELKVKLHKRMEACRNTWWLFHPGFTRVRSGVKEFDRAVKVVVRGKGEAATRELLKSEAFRSLLIKHCTQTGGTCYIEDSRLYFRTELMKLVGARRAFHDIEDTLNKMVELAREWDEAKSLTSAKGW
ncbi:MAG TPA: hypothetical protein VFV50_06560 [Bdellovibrionales bacterium]|nr:hypothetical protein [Bdellovibrionales bacterium]